jgi:hypothetical protein
MGRSKRGWAAIQVTLIITSEAAKIQNPTQLVTSRIAYMWFRLRRAPVARVTENEAKALFESKGFTHVGPFINTRTKIKAVHNVCGRQIELLYGSLKAGSGCKFCQVGGINLLKPGFIYVMTNEELGAVKVGIGGIPTKTNRIEQHSRHGWKLFKKMNFNTAEIPYELEQEILTWLRIDLSLPQYLTSNEMPQGGIRKPLMRMKLILGRYGKKFLA